MNPSVSLVIVPAWLDAAIQSNKFVKESLLDLMSLSSILSQNDVAFYTSVNMFLFDSIHSPLRETFTPFAFYNEPSKNSMLRHDGTRPAPAEVNAFYEKVRELSFNRFGVEYGQPDARSFLALLPYNSQQAEISTNVEMEYLFEAFHIKDMIFGIRFVLRDPTKPYTEQLTKCYQRLLGLLISHSTFETVAETPIFSEFVKLSRDHIKTV